MLDQLGEWIGWLPDWVRILVGLALVVFFGDMLVSAAVQLGRRHQISKAFLGLTVLAFGTSVPELSISMNSILQWRDLGSDTSADAIAIGNIVGSNICNILFVLGIPALIFRLNASETRIISIDTVLMVAVTLVFVYLVWSGDKSLGRGDGIVLLIGLVIFLAISLFMARGNADEAFGEHVEEFEYATLLGARRPGTFVIFAALVVSAIALWLSARLTVMAAGDFAEATGGTITHGIIGLSMIAFGTSLPELSITIAAARKREYSMAIGNVVGSNIFNIATIGGISAVVASFRDDAPRIVVEGMNSTAASPYGIWFDIAVMLAATLVLAAIIIWRKGRIGRPAGALLLVFYVAYLIYLFVPALPDA